MIMKSMLLCHFKGRALSHLTTHPKQWVIQQWTVIIFVNNLHLITVVHYIKSMWVWSQCQNKQIKWLIRDLSILVQINEFTDWSVAQILHPTRILVACYRQCWISQRVSRQMLVLLRWKVWPLMYYQAINSTTEARSSIRMCFRDQLQGRFCAGSRLCFLPVCLDVRAPVLILCSLCIFAQKKPDVACCSFFIFSQTNPSELQVALHELCHWVF